MLPLALAACALGALGRRVCGGLIEDITGRRTGDTPVRVFFGVTVATAAFLSGLPWLYCVALVPLTFIGTTTGNFNSLGMGRGQTSPLHDWLGMTAHGVVSGAPPAAAAAVAHYVGHAAVSWWPLAAAGVLCAPCYELGYRLTPWRPGAAWKGPRSWLLGPTTLGELFWGAACGLGAFLAGTLAS